MYRGEYFAIQCDAHVDFVLDWDASVIQQWTNANNEMAVITAYLSDVNNSMDPEGHLIRKTRPIMCKSDFEVAGSRDIYATASNLKVPRESTMSPHWNHTGRPDFRFREGISWSIFLTISIYLGYFKERRLVLVSGVLHM
jgi:hypothetical protein